MLTPAKHDISRYLQSEQQSPPTPNTANTPQLSPHKELSTCRIVDFKISGTNSVIIDLEEQNVRLMEKYLDLVQERYKLRQHVNSGLTFLGDEKMDKVQQELISMSRILSGLDLVDRTDGQDHLEVVRLKQELQKSQTLLSNIKSVIVTTSVLTMTKQKILEQNTVHPVLMKDDLQQLASRLDGIESQVINTIQLELKSINKSFKKSTPVTLVDTQGPYSKQLGELIETINSICRSYSRQSIDTHNQSCGGSTSLSRVVRSKTRHLDTNSFSMSQERQAEGDIPFYQMLLAQASLIEQFLE